MAQKQKPAFRLNGKPFALNAPTVQQARTLEFLSKMKFGDLLDTAEVAAAIGTSTGSFHNIMRSELFESYRTRYQFKCVWGHPRTIAALRKELGNAEAE